MKWFVGKEKKNMEFSQTEGWKQLVQIKRHDLKKKKHKYSWNYIHKLNWNQKLFSQG